MVRNSRSEWRARLVRYGERAHDERAVSRLAVLAAAVFGAVWFLAGGGWFLWASSVTSSPRATAAVVAVLATLYVATLVSVGAVAYVCWRVLLPDGGWSYLRGGGVGLAMGVGSHVALGFSWMIVLGVSYGVATLAGVSLLPGGPFPNVVNPVFEAIAGWFSVSLVSVELTFGLPILLGVGTGLGLTYCRKRVAAH